MNEITKIKFQKASTSYFDTILSWVAGPHKMEFWDNGQDHPSNMNKDHDFSA
jgi:hypothetical protein